MATRVIAGRPVTPVGFGAMELSFRGRPATPDAIAHIRLACDVEVALIDSAEAYCAHADEAGHNERLIAAALATVPPGDRPLVATKGGQYRLPDGSFRVEASREYLRRACERSLRNLDVNVIDLYYLHWPDPAVPFEESVGALDELARDGLIRHVGLCNIDAAQLRTACGIAEVRSVQAPLAPDRLDALPLARAAADLGVTFVAYWPFGGRHAAPSFAARHPVFADVGERRGVCSVL
jgi:aryl-alcohol dehydrogenase-like predicted oxidoreductase